MRKKDGITGAERMKRLQGRVESSYGFREAKSKLNVDGDVNIYLAYIFSKNAKELENINKELGIALVQKENAINKDNTENEVINTNRDSKERDYLFQSLSIINENLLANTGLLEKFMYSDNAELKRFENIDTQAKERPIFYISPDRTFACLGKRDSLVELVYNNLCKQIAECTKAKAKYPENVNNIYSSFIKLPELKEFLNDVKNYALTNKQNLEYVIDNAKIEELIPNYGKKILKEKIDVFIPEEAGIDDVDTVELIAKNMVWTNRLANEAKRVNINIVKQIKANANAEGKQEIDNVLENVYLELMQKEMSDDKKNKFIVLDKFITDYNRYIEITNIEKIKNYKGIDNFESSKIVMQTAKEAFEKKNLSLKDISLKNMYIYLASRMAEHELYDMKHVSANLLIDEVAKSQRMGENKYKLEIASPAQKSKNTDNEDMIAVGLNINCMAASYKVHTFKKSLLETLDKPENKNLEYDKKQEETASPINITTIYKFSDEEQIKILQKLNNIENNKQLSGMKKDEIKEINTWINQINFYINGFMDEIVENGKPKERKKIEKIAQGKNYYELMENEKEKSLAVRNTMMAILEDRVKENAWDEYGSY